MYRFARTYGFIHFGYEGVGGSGGADNGGGIDREDRTSHRRCEERDGSDVRTSVASPKDSLRVRVDSQAPSPHLVVPVRLAEVTAALLAAAGDGAAKADAGGAGESAAVAQTGARAVAEAKALEELLYRYPTTVEDDLELMRRPLRQLTEVHQARMEIAKSAAPSPASRGAVTAEWIQTCVALRVAEKIALGRELGGRTPLPRNE